MGSSCASVAANTFHRSSISTSQVPIEFDLLRKPGLDRGGMNGLSTGPTPSVVGSGVGAESTWNWCSATCRSPVRFLADGGGDRLVSRIAWARSQTEQQANRSGVVVIRSAASARGEGSIGKREPRQLRPWVALFDNRLGRCRVVGGQGPPTPAASVSSSCGAAGR